MFLVAAVPLFPVSFGPAVWLTARAHVQKSTVGKVYWPIIWAAGRVPASLRKATVWWDSIGRPAGKDITFVYGHGEATPDGSMGLNFLIFGSNAVVF